MTPPAFSRVLPTSPTFTTYEGFIPLTGSGDAWVRLEGVEARKGAGAPATFAAPPTSSSSLLRHARLVLGPELEELMKVCERV